MKVMAACENVVVTIETDYIPTPSASSEECYKARQAQFNLLFKHATHILREMIKKAGGAE